MKIGKVDVKISIIVLVAFVFFALLIVVASFFSPDVRSQLYWMLPALILLLVMPMALNYMSRKEYTRSSNRSTNGKHARSGSV